MMKKKKEEDMRKNITVSIDPRIFEIWKEYCIENEIENYSEYIEMLIKEKMGEKDIDD